MSLPTTFELLYIIIKEFILIIVAAFKYTWYILFSIYYILSGFRNFLDEQFENYELKLIISSAIIFTTLYFSSKIMKNIIKNYYENNNQKFFLLN